MHMLSFLYAVMCTCVGVVNVGWWQRTTSGTICLFSFHWPELMFAKLLAREP